MDKRDIDKAFLGIACIVIIMMALSLFKARRQPATITEDEHHRKLDSLKWELELERINRVHLINTLDSLANVNDSLIKASNKITNELSKVRGKYNSYNSKELQDKMIQVYEQRQ